MSIQKSVESFAVIYVGECCLRVLCDLKGTIVDSLFGDGQGSVGIPF